MSDMFGDDDNDIEFALKKNRIKRERRLIDDCKSINQQLEAATVGKILVLEHEIETLTAERNALKQQRDDLLAALLKVARMAEDLKRPCGMDAESPQAIRNGEYMNISYVARAAIASVKESK